MRRLATVAGITCAGAVCFADVHDAVTLVVAVEAPRGARVVARVEGRDGGTFWTKTIVMEAAGRHLVGWMPPGSHTLTVAQTFLDGGTCTATERIHSRPGDEYAAAFVETVGGGRGCQIVDAPRAALLPVPVGDFPPYVPPHVHSPRP